MTISLQSEQPSVLDQFRALVMSDEGLADTLGQIVETERFVETAVHSANTRGLPLAAENVRARLRPDPLGLSRWATGATCGSRWPPRHWLPIHVLAQHGDVFVDWAHFGTGPLTAPFFEQSIRDALTRPLNRLFRYRMRLDDDVNGADRESLTPSGFIFHMSRCGSTLVTQMLAALPHTIAISEAAPIDAIVQLSRNLQLSAEQHANCLRAMVTAYGRRRRGNDSHFVVKLDSWHALALPLFRRAFASVPWVFLYREPIEVLVSQMRQHGTQMVAEIMPPSLYGIDESADTHTDDYCALVLNKVCAAALANIELGGGLLINYRELPEAVATRILPHFGIAATAPDRETMQRVARYDAKAPSFEFTDDAAAKRREATDLVRAAAERHLADIYRRLQALNAGTRASRKR